MTSDHLQPLMFAAFPDGCSLYRQDNPVHKGKKVQVCFERDKTQFPIPQMFMQMNICGTGWTEKADPWRPCIPYWKSSAADILLPDTTAHLWHLIKSMPQRVRAVLAANGGPAQLLGRWSSDYA